MSKGKHNFHLKGKREFYFLQFQEPNIVEHTVSGSFFNDLIVA